MQSRKKTCKNYKSINSLGSFESISGEECMGCIYFSSKNCGMDLVNTLEPPLDIFC